MAETIFDHVALGTPASSGNDGQTITVGTVFFSDIDGYITKIYYYKDSTDTASSHTVLLYDTTDQSVLASKTTSGDDLLPSGWTAVTLDTPVAITNNIQYIAAVFTFTYSSTIHYLNTARSNGSHLTAPADNTIQNNGVYNYGATPTYPVPEFSESYYWTDVEFAIDIGTPSGTGSLSKTEAGDTSIGEADVKLQASLNINDNADTSNSLATIKLEASANITEATDILSSGTGIAITGLSNIAESNDTISATGSLDTSTTATFNKTEANDSSTANAGPFISGSVNGVEETDSIDSTNALLRVYHPSKYGTAKYSSLSYVYEGNRAWITELDSDTLNSSSGLIITAVANSLTEDEDQVFSIGSLYVTATLNQNEGSAEDTMYAFATIRREAALNIVEESDLLDFSTKLYIYAHSSMVEENDGFNSNTDLVIQGYMTYSELHNDTLHAHFFRKPSWTNNSSGTEVLYNTSTNGASSPFFTSTNTYEKPYIED